MNKLVFASALAAGAVSCSSPSQGSSQGVTGPSTSSAPGSAPVTAVAHFKPIGTLRFEQYRDFGVRAGSLPVPVRRANAIQLALLMAVGDSVARVDIPPAEAARMKNEVLVPAFVWYIDAASGEPREQTPYFNERSSSYFGIPDPPKKIVGHLDDPSWFAENRVTQLRLRIYAGLDTLLPFFVDESLPWTEEANKAARDVRDFFPLAAEPGLWPYYKAEGKELFAWVEKNAPPGKARLPWEDEK